MEFAVFALVPALAVLAAITWIVWQLLKGLRFLFSRLFRGVGFLGGRVFRFVRSEVVEAVQFTGAVLTAGVLVPLTGVNFVIGRWSTARHYAKAIEDEVVGAGLGLYRIALANPLHFVGLGAVLHGLERRIPDVVDRAPRRPSKRAALQFDGYDVVGTLPAGGSGALLYRARPQKETLERFERDGHPMADEVVIKSFALVQGSTLPQIVRESRALEAANRLGLVYEHHLEGDRFYYVMEFVEGDDLDTVVQRLHARSGPEGLGDRELGLVLNYTQDILTSLDRFHTGGLWHKDVKPANLIVSGDRAVLVDFGLVTPLASALTLTTHGTEYYRDPEMVRLAMQGVKVHEVDGVKFDLYSAGAVVFSMIENSFPAHGNLSQISKRCPEALTWVIRRAMADVGSRYRGAWEMRDDVAAIVAARDPFALRLADLPSVQRGDAATREDSFAGSAPDTERSANHAARVAAGADDVFDEPAFGSGRRRGARGTAACLLADQTAPSTRDGRRRRRRRVIAAAGLVFVMLSGLAALTDHLDRRFANADRGAVAASQDLRLDADEMRAYSAARAGVEEFAHAAARSSRRAEFEAPRQPAPTSFVAPMSSHVDKDAQAGLLANARVLFLDDPVNPPTGRHLDKMRDDWSESGYAIVPTTETDAFARARAVVGVGNVADDDVRARLQAHLDRTTDVDIIVWVSDKAEQVLVRSGLSQ